MRIRIKSPILNGRMFGDVPGAFAVHLRTVGAPALAIPLLSRLLVMHKHPSPLNQTQLRSRPNAPLMKEGSASKPNRHGREYGEVIVKRSHPRPGMVGSGTGTGAELELVVVGMNVGGSDRVTVASVA